MRPVISLYKLSNMPKFGELNMPPKVGNKIVFAYLKATLGLAGEAADTCG